MTRSKKRLLRISTLLMLAGHLAGCGYAYHFKTDLPPNGDTKRQWLHQGVWGKAGDNVVDLESLCPNGVSAFGSQITVFNWLPALVTLGLYTPRTAWANCSDAGGMQ